MTRKKILNKAAFTFWLAIMHFAEKDWLILCRTIRVRQSGSLLPCTAFLYFNKSKHACPSSRNHLSSYCYMVLHVLRKNSPRTENKTRIAITRDDKLLPLSLVCHHIILIPAWNVSDHLRSKSTVFESTKGKTLFKTPLFSFDKNRAQNWRFDFRSKIFQKHYYGRPQFARAWERKIQKKCLVKKFTNFSISQGLILWLEWISQNQR